MPRVKTQWEHKTIKKFKGKTFSSSYVSAGEDKRVFQLKHIGKRGAILVETKNSYQDAILDGWTKCK